MGSCKACTKTRVHARYSLKHDEVLAYEYERSHRPLRATYRSWRGMNLRCTKPSDLRYSSHGARGITVCARWRDSFESFCEDMGLKHGRGYSVDRINNDGNYVPGNCRWATPTEQARNTRSNRLVTFEGRTQCLAAWAEELNVDYRRLHSRLKRGIAFHEAIIGCRPGRAPKAAA